MKNIILWINFYRLNADHVVDLFLDYIIIAKVNSVECDGNMTTNGE
jgi:hypothetical protein